MKKTLTILLTLLTFNLALASGVLISMESKGFLEKAESSPGRETSCPGYSDKVVELVVDKFSKESGVIEGMEIFFETQNISNGLWLIIESADDCDSMFEVTNEVIKQKLKEEQANAFIDAMSERGM